MRKNITHLLTGLLILLVSFSSRADHLRAHLLLGSALDGAQEVPAVTTAARGVASFTLNGTRDTLFISGSFTGLSGSIVAAHTHLGARGVSGPVVTDLFRFIRGNRIQGYLTGSDIDRGKLDRYLRGGYYLNIHTSANPNGEIRGQIELEKDEEFLATLSGAQEVPPVTTNGAGLGTFNLSQARDKIKFRAIVAGLSGPITAAHFHQGAVGVSGPVVLDLMPYISGNVIEGELTPTPAIVTAMLAGQIYINVHTMANPNGEVRGQLFRQARFISHDARLDAAQLVPAGTATGKGVAVLQLNTTLDTLNLLIGHTGLSGPPTSLQFFAANAGVANSSAPLLTVPLPATAPNFIGASITGLDAAAVNLFLLGGANLVYTTAANPNGEVRGQVYRLAREGYTFSMNGLQERPTPNNSTAYGSGFVSMDRDQSNVHFNMVWGGLTGPVTVGHFHTGLINQSGGVVFDLAPFFNPSGMAAISAEGYWQATGNTGDNSTRPFTARRALQFRRDSMYANIHTAMYPGGEIRGQVFRGARNLSVILSNGPSALVAETFGYYPNPFRDELTLSFESRSSGTATVNVADLLGRTVATKSVLVRVGANQPRLELPGIAPGVYLVTVDIAGSRLVSRVVKE